MSSARAESPSPLAAHPESTPARRFALGGYTRQIFCVVLFFLLAIAFSPACAVLARCVEVAPATARRWIRGLFAFWLRCAIRLRVFEIEFPPEAALRALRGTIIAPNHPTLIDAVMLLSVLPDAVCIMRASLMKSPFLGGAARVAEYVTNDSGRELIRQGARKISSGENLLIFPEGTRTRDGAINPFQHGFALIATKTGAPIQTVFIERECRYLSKGVSLFSPARPPFRFRIRLGDTFRPAPGERAQQLSTRLEAYFRDALVRAGDAIRLKAPR